VCTLCVHEHISYTYCNLDIYFLYTHVHDRIRHEYCRNKSCATACSADFKQNLRLVYSEFRRINRKGLLMRSNFRIRIIRAPRDNPLIHPLRVVQEPFVQTEVRVTGDSVYWNSYIRVFLITSDSMITSSLFCSYRTISPVGLSIGPIGSGIFLVLHILHSLQNSNL